MNKGRRHVSEIIGNEETEDLRKEVLSMIEDGCSYEEVEDVMLDYGVEMDYLEDIVF